MSDTTGAVGPSLIQFAYSCEGYRTTLSAYVLFGASGAITSANGIQQWNPAPQSGFPAQNGTYSVAPKTTFGVAPTGSRGVASVTNNGTGDYTFAFQGAYARLLGVRATQIFVGGTPGSQTPVTPLSVQVALPSTATALAPGVCTPVEVLLVNASSALANPATGEVILFTFEFDGSGW